MSTEEKIYLNTNFSEDERNDVLFDASSFLIHRSGVTFDRLLFTTKYSRDGSTIKFFNLIYSGTRQVNVTNSKIQIVGDIMTTQTPAQVYFANTEIDFYESRNGVDIIGAVGEKEDLEQTYLIGESINIYFSQPKTRNIGQRQVFTSRGYGDFKIRNSRFGVYAKNGEIMWSFAKWWGSGSDLNISKTYEVLFENIYVTNDYFDETSVYDSPTSVRMNGWNNINVNVTLSNVTFDRLYGSGGLNILALRATSSNHIVMENVIIKNAASIKPLFNFTSCIPSC